MTIEAPTHKECYEDSPLLEDQALEEETALDVFAHVLEDTLTGDPGRMAYDRAILNPKS